MPETLDDQIAQLKNAAAALEAQRETLGEAVVEAGLAPMRARLAELLGELPEQQRKLVTLLFMDIVNSTPIVRQLDPEEALEVMDSTLKRLAAPVEARGGRVTRYMGDGFKAVFGLPLAREDDPEQAVMAGLEIQGKASEIAMQIQARLGRAGFQVRVGINAGRVATGGLTELEDTVMGSPVNLAARMQTAAPPGGVLISHDTYHHVRGIFEVTPLEPLLPKGFDRPVKVYRIERRKPRAFGLRTPGVEGVATRMVGREMELKRLQDALTTAIDGEEGQLITMIGEAGVGKSRLLYEFTNWIDLLPQPVRLFQGRCRPETQPQPYALWRDVFASHFQIQESEPSTEVYSKLENGFGEVFGADEPGQARAHLLAQLIGFDFSASPHLKGMLEDPQQLRHQGLNALDEFFRLHCQTSPVVVFLEDIHWADDSSLDGLNQLGRLTAQNPLLVLCLARHTLLERRPFWGEGLPYHTRLELRPLTRRESRQLVEEILQKVEQVPAELNELVLRGAEGIPFYIEELIKMLIEQGAIVTGEDRWQVEPQRLAQVNLPSTLTGVLQARLDGLPAEERKILQQASVVGRTFWDQTLAHLQAITDKEQALGAVAATLSNLRGRELVFRHEQSAFAGAGEYLFKHEVLRDVTYESVLLRLRRLYHGLVADWLIERLGEGAGEYSGTIAAHLELAGQPERAVPYLLRVGDHARSTYANQEAIGYYRHGLALSPAPAERAELLSGLGEVLFDTGRYGAIEVWLEGIEIYRSLGNLNGLARLYARAARVAGFLDGPVRGLQLCELGLEQTSGAAESVEMAILYHEAGRAYHFNRLPDKAWAYCQQALDMAERLGAVEVQADTLATIGVLPGQTRDQAHQNLEKAFSLAERHRLLRIANRALNNLADSSLFVTGDLYACRQAYQRCGEIAHQRGSGTEELFARIGLIRISLDLEEFTQYAGQIGEIEVLASVLADTDVIKQEFHLLKATWLTRRGLWDRAFDFILHLLPQVRQSLRLGNFYALLGLSTEAILEKDFFTSVSEWSEVEATLEEAREDPYAEKARLYSFEKILFYYQLSTVGSRQGRLEAARRWLELAREQRGNWFDFWSLTWVVKGEYELALAEGSWEDALAASEKLIELFTSKGIHWHRARALLNPAQVFTRRGAPGDQERAHEYYRQALQAFQALGAEGYVEAIQQKMEQLGDS